MSFINLYTGRFQFTHATANLDVVGDMAILDSRLGERFLQRGNGNQKNLRMMSFHWLEFSWKVLLLNHFQRETHFFIDCNLDFPVSFLKGLRYRDEEWKWSSLNQNFQHILQQDPMKISIGMDEARANPNVAQDIRMVTELEKKHAFFNWLQEVSPVGKPAPRILIFIDTKKGAHALCRELRYEQFAAGEIHGDKDQTERDAMLHNFRKGKCQILVATDVAQRGLDIKDVDYVSGHLKL